MPSEDQQRREWEAWRASMRRKWGPSVNARKFPELRPGSWCSASPGTGPKPCFCSWCRATRERTRP
jgi:hypothetical protein